MHRIVFSVKSSSLLETNLRAALWLRFPTIFHQVLFILLLTVRKVTLTSLLVEFTATPLALDPIIKCFYWFLALGWLGVGPTTVAVAGLHCLSEHHGLLLPLWYFLSSNWCLGFRRWLRPTAFSEWLRILILFLQFLGSVSFSLFLHVKGFSLCLACLCADLLVLVESVSRKLPSADAAWVSLAVISYWYAVGRCRVWVCLHGCSLVNTRSTAALLHGWAQLVDVLRCFLGIVAVSVISLVIGFFGCLLGLRSNWSSSRSIPRPIDGRVRHLWRLTMSKGGSLLLFLLFFPVVLAVPSTAIGSRSIFLVFPTVITIVAPRSIIGTLSIILILRVTQLAPRRIRASPFRLVLR